MDSTLTDWLEELAEHQYRYPRLRKETYWELLSMCPEDANYLYGFCLACYLTGSHAELEDFLKKPSIPPILEAIRCYWLGNLEWANRNAKRATELWNQGLLTVDKAMTPKLLKRLALADHEWNVFETEGLTLYIEGSMYVQDHINDAIILAKLGEARQRFCEVVGEPFCYACRVYLTSDKSRVIADTDLGEVYGCVCDDLFTNLLFTVDGRWPNYHRELYTALSGWAKGMHYQIDALKTNPDTLRLPGLFSAPLRFRETQIALANFIDYLIKVHGWPRIVRWMRETELIRSFAEVFGYGWNDAGLKWRSYLNMTLSMSAESATYKSLPHALKTALENFWSGVMTRDWDIVSAYLSDLSRLEILKTDFQANRDSWGLCVVEPDALYLNTDVGLFKGHYVFAKDKKPWAVVNIEFEQVDGGRWLLVDWQVYALEFRMWEERCAEGYIKNRPWNGMGFRSKVLEMASERGIEKPVICELGVGSGRIAEAFVVEGDRYIGLDNSTIMTDEFKRRLKCRNQNPPENLTLVLCDLNSGIPLPDNSVDIIIEVQVFDSMKKELFLECARVLRSNGFLMGNINGNSEYQVADKPETWCELSHYQWEILPALLNLSSKPWPELGDFRRLRPKAEDVLSSTHSPSCDQCSDVQYIETVPPPDLEWKFGNPLVTLVYEKNLRERIREGCLKRTIFWPPAPEPWYSEQYRLVEEEADRLGIDSDESVSVGRFATGKLWEASSLKKWRDAMFEVH